MILAKHSSGRFQVAGAPYTETAMVDGLKCYLIALMIVKYGTQAAVMHCQSQIHNPLIPAYKSVNALHQINRKHPIAGHGSTKTSTACCDATVGTYAHAMFAVNEALCASVYVCYAMLCHAIPCHAMLCHAMPCCARLSRAVPQALLMRHGRILC